MNTDKRGNVKFFYDGATKSYTFQTVFPLM